MLTVSKLLSLFIISVLSSAIYADIGDIDDPATPTSADVNHESIGTNFPFSSEPAATVTTNSPAIENSAAPSAEITKASDGSKPAAPITESSKTTISQCTSTNHLQKSLLVMAFPQLKPTSANAGNLYQAEYELPQLLSQQLVTKHLSIAPIQLGEALATAGSSSEVQLAEQIQHLAANHRSQLVVSGEILDMSMAQPNALYNPGLYTRFLNGLFDFIEIKNRFDKRDRLFSFQVHLRDGFTGQQLFSKRYDTYGVWPFSQPVGFATPLFWQSDYGQQIKGLVKQASFELGEAINCQPFIAKIDSRPGQTQIILQGGANNGLHAGDMLSLYQLVVQGSETRYAEHDIRLINRNAAIELREVYASHSVGIINSSDYLVGQLLAVAP